MAAANGRVALVLSEEMDEDAMELVVVLVLPEVIVDLDSPFNDVLVGEALSTPLEKIRMQART